MNGIEKGLLSVCCLGYNHARFISSCIKAIWVSKYEKIEIIVVDDGSSDDSLSILKGLAKESPFPMRLVFQKNTGNIGYNFNQALKVARGEFITFMSLDDVLHEKAIDRVLPKLIEHENLAFIVSSKIDTIDENDNRNARPVSPLQLDMMTGVTVDDLLELEWREFNSFYIQGCFWRKEIIDSVKGFDEDMTGDDIVLRTKVFLYLRAHPYYSFLILKDPLCRYRQHGSNISKNGIRQLRIVTEYLDRYCPDRENPPVLVRWVLDVLRKTPKQKWFDVFSLNERVLSLLKEDEIIALLREPEKKVSVLIKIPFLLEVVKIKSFISGERTLACTVCLKTFSWKLRKKR